MAPSPSDAGRAHEVFLRYADRICREDALDGMSNASYSVDARAHEHQYKILVRVTSEATIAIRSQSLWVGAINLLLDRTIVLQYHNLLIHKFHIHTPGGQERRAPEPSLWFLEGCLSGGRPAYASRTRVTRAASDYSCMLTYPAAMLILLTYIPGAWSSVRVSVNLRSAVSEAI